MTRKNQVCCANCAFWDRESLTRLGRVRLDNYMAKCLWLMPSEMQEALRKLPESVAQRNFDQRMMAGGYGSECVAFVRRELP